MNHTNYVHLLNIMLLMSIQTAFASPFVYVANTGTGSVTVSVIDAATNSAGVPVTMGEKPNFTAIAITPDNQTVYVGCFDSVSGLGSVQRIDIATSAHILPDIALGATEPNDLAIAPNGIYAYVTCDDDTVKRINIATNSIDNTVALTGADSIAITSDSLYAYVTSTSGDVVPLNLSSFTTNAPLAVTSAATIALTPDDAYAYVTSFTTGVLYQLDLSTRSTPTISNNISIGALYGPQGVAITPNGLFAYTANANNGTVTPVDISNPASLVRGTDIVVGSQPNQIAITSDGTKAFVTNFNDDTVSPIDLETNTALTAIPVGSRPNGLAITSGNLNNIVLPPTNVIGTRSDNIFLLRTERILTITWTASSSANIASYNIYNDTTLIGNVLATSTLCFRTLLAPCDNGTNFSITAVNTSGTESAHASVTVQ